MAEKEQAATLHISELPVLQVLVIGFHHHKGSTVEYNYPPLNPSSPDQSLTSSLPSQWKPLPHIALPDGCHNYQQGHVIFTLLSPSSDTQVYGISCYRQIESKELSPSIDVTRSTIQKAVCVISRWPTFSVIESKLRLATHAYFNSKDFNDISILVQLYDDLNSTLTVDHALSVVAQGYDIINIVFSLQHKVLQILKAILLQKRVMVFGSNAGITSSCVMSIVSLFPSSLESLINPLISKDNEHGLPLNIFPKETSLQPYLSLQQMDILTNLEYSCVLVGAVNPLYFKQHDKLVDIVYNIDLNQLYTNNSHMHTMLKLSSADLRFFNVLLEAARTQIESNEGELSVKPTNWYGSEEWLRSQFKSYLLGLLATTLSGDSVAFDDYNLEFVKNFMKTRMYLQWIETPHDGILKIPPRHICDGELSLSDLKRQLTVRASDYGLVTSKQVEQVGRVMQKTGHVISATKDSIHNTISNWWTSTSSAVITWWGDTASQDVESEEEEEEQEEKVKENVVS